MKTFTPPPPIQKLVALILVLLLGSPMFASKTFGQTSSIGSCATPDGSGATPAFRSSSIVTTTDCENPNTVKYLKVNYHFVLRTDGTGNFTETQDGLGNPYNGYQRAEDVILEANHELAANPVSWMQTLGFTYPSPANPKNIRYILTGVYFHRSDALYNSSSSGTAISVVEPYSIDKANTINIFEVYKSPILSGISGNVAIIGETDQFIVKNYTYNEYAAYAGTTAPYLYLAPSTTNHEIGHLLNLHHAWHTNTPSFYGDGCEDTPTQAIQCWSIDATNPNCDEWTEISNNMLSYNGNYPHALTTCQVGRLQNHLINTDAYNTIYSCNSCVGMAANTGITPAYSNFLMNDADLIYYDLSNINLNGAMSFNEASYKIDICKIGAYYPLGTSCVSGTYSTGWISGTIGNVNLSALYPFAYSSTYKITLTTNNGFCPLEHTKTTYIKTRIKKLVSVDVIGYSEYSRKIAYELSEGANVTIKILNPNYGNIEKTVYENCTKEAGIYEDVVEVGDLCDGIHKVIIYVDGEIEDESFLKF